ncbi:ribosomal RNA small subunit methyltransferase E [Methyloglobulus morosus KoM1]|uniref:Ribosomal RNA small subunit methyltransferase E n=1 Tax=Methyloglobulus morosus KoM1 TaxID=1116472 RepID=V5BQZ4_9GAMM|nr:16S rRNA (uracil(1498)-N(3))-methyltransferase [Methyloglobulus morosus]ESS70274.1 ribosomal RNA small subunit methyltransferase E [Methyloglobulus morosus KoM1]
MRVSRLYVDLPLVSNEQVELDEDGGHYVRTVLRLKKDDAIILFNGRGGEYACVLAEVSRKTVRIKVNAWSGRSIESPLSITLGLGISRGDRMDWSVQKAVELGVNQLVPIITERCVVQLKGEKKLQRLQHWQKIVQHAAEQSGRTVLPEMTEIATLQNWVSDQHGLKMFLDPYADLSMAQLHPDGMEITLLTGPEGGFADQERSIAKAAGFTPVRLGNRILRTETAAIAAIAAAQMLWGDFALEGRDTDDG